MRSFGHSCPGAWIVPITLAATVFALPGCYDDDEDTNPSPTWAPTITPVPDQDADGYVQGEDCDDSDASVNPDATEVCDGIDNDCDGQTDEELARTWYLDEDGDGYGGATVNDTECAQPDGYVSDPGDCADDDPAVYPGATDICDEKDNDCDNVTDEDPDLTFYADLDGDGYGAGDPIAACPGTTGMADNNLDCDDSSAALQPGALEVDGNDVDENCDGVDRTVHLYVTVDGTNPYSDAPAVTSIQEAIDTAYTGQTIAVGPGTYREKVRFNGKNIYLTSMFGPETTVVDGGGRTDSDDDIDSIFLFVDGEGTEGGEAVVRGFTIRGGRGTDGEICGNAFGEVTGLRYGGAVCTRGAEPVLIGNIIEDNSVDGSGGALYLDEGPVDLIDNIIRNNSADYDAGGINLSQSSGDITGNVIIDNEAGRYGGGFFAYESSGLVANNIIAFNAVTNSKPIPGGGAGVCLHDSYPTLTNNVIAYNDANPDAGGVRIFNVAEGGELINNVITGNDAIEEGGGIRVGSGSVTARNNIVAFNKAASGANAFSVSETGLMSNFNIYYSTGGSSDVVGFTLGAQDIVADPGLVDDPTDFVVEDDDYRLKEDSTAIDSGASDEKYNDTDGSTNDIGAYGGPRGADFLYYTMADIVALRTE